MKKNVINLLFFVVAFFISFGSTSYGEGITYNMGESGDFNIRIDGPTDSSGDSSALSYAALATEDLDSDGKKDLVIGARRFDAEGKTDSGSIYIIFGTLLDNYSGIGNIIDLDDTSNYNIRYDGALADDETGKSVEIADVNGNGKADLLFASYQEDNNGSNSGSAYVIYDSLIDDYSGTGNNVDLSDSSNWNIRFDGEAAGVQLGNIMTADFNGNGDRDLLMWQSAGSGGVFLVDSSIFSGISDSGNILSLASSTSYSVQYDAPHVYFDSVTVGNLNGNDSDDLIIGSPFSSFSGGSFGSAYVISDNLIEDAYSGTGDQVSLASSTNYNIRYDGQGLLSRFGGIKAEDLDGNGIYDLAFADASFDLGLDKGSVYVIYDSLLEQHSGTGNNIEIWQSNNHSFRFQGDPFDADGLNMVSGTVIKTEDLDSDGETDLVFSDVGDAAGNGTEVGNTYVIFHSLLEELQEDETGNLIDLSLTDSYNIRYNGENEGDWLGASAINLSDINNDGLPDILMGAWGADNNTSGSGSLYIIYYFPHTITLDSLEGINFAEPFEITGTVSAPDNPTHIAAVEWGHDRSFGDDSGDFHSTWRSCTASDGAFDSNEEDFTCSHSALDIGDPNFNSPHTVFFRAKDEKGIYTPISLYPTATYKISSNGSGGRLNNILSDNDKQENEQQEDEEDTEDGVESVITEEEGREIQALIDEVKTLLFQLIADIEKILGIKISLS